MDALAASSSEVWPGASPTPEVARPVIAVNPRGKVPPIKASSNRIEHENRRLVFLRHARLHLHADPNVFGSHAFDPAHQPWPFVEVYQRDMIGRGRRFAADDGDRIDGARAHGLHPFKVGLARSGFHHARRKTARSG